jgi:hypothetical protein
LTPRRCRSSPPTGPEGLKRLERIGVLTSSPLQMLLTAASMVACINAIVGGVPVALAVRSLLDAPILVAAPTGAVVALAVATLCFGYHVRRSRRAAAVVPELNEGQSPDLPGWVEHPGEAVTRAWHPQGHRYQLPLAPAALA